MTAPPWGLSVVIVTHQSGAVIGPCLTALAALGRIDEAIVVDNGSTDDTLARVADFPVDCLRNDANLGFSRAANQGARKAAGPILCFLNPDCALTGEAVELGLAQLRREPQSLAAPTFRHADGQVVEGRQPGYTARKLLADVLHGGGAGVLARRLEAGGRHHDPTWHWPIGACFFVSRDVFLAVGGFDERFFLYMEDVVLGRDVARAGGRTVALPCTLLHQSRCGSDVTAAFRNAELDRARIAYARHFHGRALAVALRLVRGALRRPPFRWLR